MRYAQSHCTYTERQDPKKGHVYDFTGKCIMTGLPVTVTVVGSELFAYNQGGYIQNTLISNTIGEREFLISGMSEVAFDEMFKDDEEDDICDRIVEECRIITNPPPYAPGKP